MSVRSRSVLSRSAPTAGALALAAILAFSAAPAGVAQTTLLDITIANPMFSDFEDGPQDWSANPGQDPNSRPPPTPSWQWGVPTSGPGAAASGSKVWATNLAGNYTSTECAGLMSPVLDLTTATSASIAFKHWRHFELSSATGTAWDAGTLMVTANNGQTFTRVNVSGYNTQTVGTTTRTCWDAAPTFTRGFTGPIGTALPPSNYSANSLDLSAFLGQQVRVVFAFGSDSSGHRAGWYLDDVATTIDGVTTVEDFETSDGGFTMVGTKVPGPVALGWSHGVPTTGPGNATALWATNLNGNHGPNECHWIESPAIDLGPLPPEGSAVATATLSWLQWFRSSSSTAAGVVQVGHSGPNGTEYTIVAPTGGYPAAPTSTILDACLHHLAPGLGAFAGLVDTVGGPMTEFEADLSPWIGQSVTVRYLFASTSSTSTNPGWYVDDVNVEVALTAVAPSVEDLGIPGVGGADAPLWTSGGPVSTWSYGVTTTTPANNTTYKTNLNGMHAANECSYIDSPAIPGALLATSPSLAFEHWHRIAGTSVNVPWAVAIVLISEDGGTTWTHLNMSDHQKPIYTTTYNEVFDNCLVNFGADKTLWGYGKDSRTAVPGAVDGWYTSTADLSAYADAPSVRVRFAYASDGTFAYEGWAIRSVTLGGVKVL